MAYFLKKTNNKKGLYLQIYESHWDPHRGHTVNKSVKALGYEHELKEKGITDPISHFKSEIDKMNEKRKAKRAKDKVKKITNESPELYLGQFILQALNEKIGVERDFSYLQMAAGFKFSLYNLVSDLVYARAVDPCSKYRTYTEVLPQLAGAHVSYSIDQLYDGVAFLGQKYQKVIEIYNSCIDTFFNRDTSKSYFDCTNFFFEIDKEDILRKKGPSKENRCDPIVGLGLLLDAECIPLAMSIYPGNESEKPVMQKVISQAKRRNNMTGKTIRVADKGLNCADNIADAILAGDGYIFSKSIKQLPRLEQEWVFLEQGWNKVYDSNGDIAYLYKSCVDEFSYKVSTAKGHKKNVVLKEKRVVTFNPKLERKQHREIARQVEKAKRLRLAAAKKSEYGESAKFVTFCAVDKNGEKPNANIVATLNHEAIQKAYKFAGYNMLVSSETTMQDQEIYSVYHELWQIEKTFKIMKSQLDARPVFMQKPESIAGHFLICYLAVLLERLLQVKILENQFSTEDVMEFIRRFRAVKISDRKYVNISKASKLFNKLETMTELPIRNYYLSKGQVDSIIEYKFDLKERRQ